MNKLHEERDASGPIRCVIYAAKSTEDGRGSIPTQLDDCRAAIERKGIRFVYSQPLPDENASAFKRNRGPGLAKRLAVEAAVREDGEDPPRVRRQIADDLKALCDEAHTVAFPKRSPVVS